MRNVHDFVHRLGVATLALVSTAHDRKDAAVNQPPKEAQNKAVIPTALAGEDSAVGLSFGFFLVSHRFILVRSGGGIPQR